MGFRPPAEEAVSGNCDIFVAIIQDIPALSAYGRKSFLFANIVGGELSKMPSQSVLEQKQGVVQDLKVKIDGAVAGVLVDYKGISVADDTKLRRELREAGVDYAVVKNTLLRRAVEGTAYEALTDSLAGSTALAVSSDPVAAAKILDKFAMATKGTFALKSGFVEGKVLDQAGIVALAKLPGKEQLLVQLLSVLNGNIRGLAAALQAVADKAEPAA